jgi:hypothetical protein
MTDDPCQVFIEGCEPIVAKVGRPEKAIPPRPTMYIVIGYNPIHKWRPVSAATIGDGGWFLRRDNAEAAARRVENCVCVFVVEIPGEVAYGSVECDNCGGSGDCPRCGGDRRPDDA